MDKLIIKHDKRPIKGDIYTITDLKVVLDNLLCEYLKENGHKQSFVFENIKLFIGFVSSIIAIFVCYLSMYYEFDKIEMYLWYLILSYFVVNGIYYIINWIEGGKLYFEDLEISTQISDVPVYLILIYKKNNSVLPTKYTKSLYDLFYENGRLDHKLFLNDLENVFSELK